MIGTLIAASLDVRSKPLRTFAAIAGMVVAVAAVVLVDAASILSRDANDEYIATTYGRTATVSIFPTGDGGARPIVAEGPGSDTAVDGSTQVSTLLRNNGVTRLTTNVDTGLVLVNGEHVVHTRAHWVSSTYPDVSIIHLAAGDFSVETARSDVLHAVITQGMAQQLGFTEAEAVGQTVLYAAGSNVEGTDVQTTPLRWLVIDAVAESLGSAADGSDVLLISDLYRPDLLDGQSMSWLVHVNPADIDLVRGLVENSVLATASGQPAFSVRRTDQGENLAPVLSQQEVTAGAVTTVALIVGGLGILGVGLASVRERAKDFGLRRKLGASKARIFAGVIVQTLLEVVLAAAIAIPLSAIAVELFARQLVLATLPLPSSTALPMSSAMRGLIAALMVGLIAGLLPAVRAARASVVQALRG